MKVIEAYGGFGERVESPDLLVDALKRGREAVRTGKTALLDVVVAT